MRRVIISGGPHTGKSTLLEALKSKYPDADFVPEPAQRVITRELIEAAADPKYIPRLPTFDYSLFAPLVLAEALKLEAATPSKADLVFQDRSLIDTVGYCRLNGLEDFIPETQRRIKDANYAFALFCEPVGEYQATEIRRETAEEAALTHTFLAEAYDSSGIEVIHLPNVPVNERLAIIREHLLVI